MVQLEEVEDEEFDRVHEGEKDFNDDDDFTDTGTVLIPSFSPFVLSLDSHSAK